jgi:hypothetical protein
MNTTERSDRPFRRVGKPVQPASLLAARRRARVSRAQPRAALDRDGRAVRDLGLTSESLLVLLALAGAANALGAAPEEPDTGVLGMYVALALTLAVMTRIQVPVAAG